MDIIRLKIDLHPDGDIYVEKKDGSMQRVGCIGESSFANLPDKYYTKIKKIAKIYK